MIWRVYTQEEKYIHKSTLFAQVKVFVFEKLWVT
jgi:hypothetical protein